MCGVSLLTLGCYTILFNNSDFWKWPKYQKWKWSKSEYQSVALVHFSPSSDFLADFGTGKPKIVTLGVSDMQIHLVRNAASCRNASYMPYDHDVKRVSNSKSACPKTPAYRFLVCRYRKSAKKLERTKVKKCISIFASNFMLCVPRDC